MNTRRISICAIIAPVLAFTGCATSPEDEQRRIDMEADVDEILSYELDPAEYGEPKACLFDSEYRNYDALGNRHLLFRGRKGKQWVNVLRGRCFGLDDDSVFVVKPSIGGRLCDTDRFIVADRADSLSSVSTSPTCFLGEFKPVTEAQVKEIEDRLEMH